MSSSKLNIKQHSLSKILPCSTLEPYEGGNDSFSPESSVKNHQESQIEIVESNRKKVKNNRKLS